MNLQIVSIYPYIAICLAGLLAIYISEFVFSKQFRAIAKGVVITCLALLVLHVLIGQPLNFIKSFPKANTYGDDFPIETIFFVILIAATLGTIARYIFDYKTNQVFSFLSLAKPIVITPIIILPIVGTLNTDHPNLKFMQFMCILLLSFQNGFFWRTILEKRIKSSV